MIRPGALARTVFSLLSEWGGWGSSTSPNRPTRSGVGDESLGAVQHAHRLALRVADHLHRAGWAGIGGQDRVAAARVVGDKPRGAFGHPDLSATTAEHRDLGWAGAVVEDRHAGRALGSETVGTGLAGLLSTACGEGDGKQPGGRRRPVRHNPSTRMWMWWKWLSMWRRALE